MPTNDVQPNEVDEVLSTWPADPHRPGLTWCGASTEEPHDGRECVVCYGRYLDVKEHWRDLYWAAAWEADTARNQPPVEDVPHLLYVIEHGETGLIKIGIARADGSRLVGWRQRGWTVRRTWSFGDLATARGEETVRKNRCRRLPGATVRPEDMPAGRCDGWTETFWLTDEVFAELTRTDEILDDLA